VGPRGGGKCGTQLTQEKEEEKKQGASPPCQRRRPALCFLFGLPPTRRPVRASPVWFGCGWGLALRCLVEVLVAAASAAAAAPAPYSIPNTKAGQRRLQSKTKESPALNERRQCGAWCKPLPLLKSPSGQRLRLRSVRNKTKRAPGPQMARPKPPSGLAGRCVAGGTRAPLAIPPLVTRTACGL
jgi:hypothetical protein